MTYQNDPNRRTRPDQNRNWSTIGIIGAIAAVVLLGLLLFMGRDDSTTGVATRDPGTQTTAPKNQTPPATPSPGNTPSPTPAPTTPK